MPDTGVAPVSRIPPDDATDAPEVGLALCLSGGGYRAMLFHLGSLWRLAELRLLTTDVHVGRGAGGAMTSIGSLQRVSSVSGGSIASAQLALGWAELANAPPNELMSRFHSRVTKPLRDLAGTDLVGMSVRGVLRLVRNILLPGSVNDHLARAYAKHLYGAATLKDIPATPRFIFNASNLHSGALWRFSNPYIADWRVGRMLKTGKVSLARAVAASSAFPPFLAPATFEFDESDWEPSSGGKGTDNLQRPPFTTRPQLADGGVYDNLGLETAYKRYRTVLVSDGGAPFAFDEKVPANWASIGSRVIGLVDNQVRSLRKRLLIESYTRGERSGAYWGIDQDITRHGCTDPLPCPRESTSRLAQVPTDLAAKPPALQEQLINWGYAVTDAALRAHVNSAWPKPAGLPYPDAGVG